MDKTISILTGKNQTDESKDKRYILEISIKLRKRGIGDLSVKKWAEFVDNILSI